jgi:hypothetical protein
MLRTRGMTHLGRREALVGALLMALGCSSVGQDPGGEGGAGGAASAGRGGTGGDDSCNVGGTVYPNGSSFRLDCNTCTCTSGEALCTTIGCIGDGGLGRGGMSGAGTGGQGGSGGLDGGPLVCSFDASYTISSLGGLVAYTDVATLSPPNAFTFTRTWFTTDASPTSRSCAPSLPECGDPNKVDVNDITSDLADADVQAAFAMPAPTLYGVDARDVDGPLYQIARSTGGTVQVGYDCPATSSSCRQIPAGLARLVADLRTLIDTQTTGGVCENVTRPFPL